MAQPLSLLMEAPSKDLVQRILTHVYMHRNNIAQANAAKFAPMFEKPDAVTEEHVQQLFAALHGVVTKVLYEGISTAEQIRTSLDHEPASTALDEQLKKDSKRSKKLKRSENGPKTVQNGLKMVTKRCENETKRSKNVKNGLKCFEMATGIF